MEKIFKVKLQLSLLSNFCPKFLLWEKNFLQFFAYYWCQGSGGSGSGNDGSAPCSGGGRLTGKRNGPGRHDNQRDHRRPRKGNGFFGNLVVVRQNGEHGSDAKETGRVVK